MVSKIVLHIDKTNQYSVIIVSFLNLMFKFSFFGTFVEYFGIGTLPNSHIYGIFVIFGLSFEN